MSCNYGSRFCRYLFNCCGWLYCLTNSLRSSSAFSLLATRIDFILLLNSYSILIALYRSWIEIFASSATRLRLSTCFLARIYNYWTRAGTDMLSSVSSWVLFSNFIISSSEITNFICYLTGNSSLIRLWWNYWLCWASSISLESWFLFWTNMFAWLTDISVSL